MLMMTEIQWWLETSIANAINCVVNEIRQEIRSVISSVLAFRPVRLHKIYFIIKSTEILSLPWKPSKVTRNLVLLRFPRCRISWTKTIFKRGCCQKMTLFPPKKIIWDATYSHPFQNLELALKFQISDKKAHLSDYHLQLKVLDKILLLRYKYQ